MCKNVKRVEGNAGQILDKAPKNKPYNTMKTDFFFCLQTGSFSLKTFKCSVDFCFKDAKPYCSVFYISWNFFRIVCSRS
uniref:Uncharacterized protein n=1 Tax=uncultured marine crenarchaeote HF4000_ANIW93E5 TaxID=455563 RepID=B3T2N7_9ARCH|nr:hypothetical protein ALOHA_HF4000ANIW93E5ctg6g14 [uncultured marine crenarchaeote HF4000_ANIW93E5]